MFHIRPKNDEEALLVIVFAIFVSIGYYLYYRKKDMPSELKNCFLIYILSFIVFAYFLYLEINKMPLMMNAIHYIELFFIIFLIASGVALKGGYKYKKVLEDPKRRKALGQTKIIYIIAWLLVLIYFIVIRIHFGRFFV